MLYRRRRGCSGASLCFLAWSRGCGFLKSINVGASVYVLPSGEILLSDIPSLGPDKSRGASSVYQASSRVTTSPLSDCPIAWPSTNPHKEGVTTGPSEA